MKNSLGCGKKFKEFICGIADSGGHERLCRDCVLKLKEKWKEGKFKEKKVNNYEESLLKLQLIKEFKEKKVSSAKEIFKFSKDFRGLDKEVFVVFHLNTQNKIIKREIVSIGILDASIVHPREIFRNAIISNSSKIILCHNHPSGNITPSNEDIEITKKLEEIGEILSIRVVDSIIVSKNNFGTIIHN